MPPWPALLDIDFRSATLDYIELLKLVRVVTRDQREVEQMFRRMAFNVRVLNRDKHLKNFALMIGRDGAWRLAPAYDLSFSTGPGGEHPLTVAGEGRRPGRTHVVAVAAKSGVKPARAQEIIAEIDHAVQNWRPEADRLRVSRALLRTIDEAMGAARTW